MNDQNKISVIDNVVVRCVPRYDGSFVSIRIYAIHVAFNIEKRCVAVESFDYSILHEYAVAWR